MKDMISLFKDIAVADTSFNAVMVDSFEKEEDGLDNSGVFLDALSAFWNSFYDCCALMAKMREFQSSGTICRLLSGRPWPEELSKGTNKLVFF